MRPERGGRVGLDHHPPVSAGGGPEGWRHLHTRALRGPEVVFPSPPAWWPLAGASRLLTVSLADGPRPTQGNPPLSGRGQSGGVPGLAHGPGKAGQWSH